MNNHVQPKDQLKQKFGGQGCVVVMFCVMANIVPEMTVLCGCLIDFPGYLEHTKVEFCLLGPGVLL